MEIFTSTENIVVYAHLPRTVTYPSFSSSIIIASLAVAAIFSAVDLILIGSR